MLEPGNYLQNKKEKKEKKQVCLRMPGMSKAIKQKENEKEEKLMAGKVNNTNNRNKWTSLHALQPRKGKKKTEKCMSWMLHGQKKHKEGKAGEIESLTRKMKMSACMRKKQEAWTCLTLMLSTVWIFDKDRKKADKNRKGKKAKVL